MSDQTHVYNLSLTRWPFVFIWNHFGALGLYKRKLLISFLIKRFVSNYTLVILIMEISASPWQRLICTFFLKAFVQWLVMNKHFFFPNIQQKKTIKISSAYTSEQNMEHKWKTIIILRCFVPVCLLLWCSRQERQRKRENFEFYCNFFLDPVKRKSVYSPRTLLNLKWTIKYTKIHSNFSQLYNSIIKQFNMKINYEKLSECNNTSNLYISGCNNLLCKCWKFH